MAGKVVGGKLGVTALGAAAGAIVVAGAAGVYVTTHHHRPAAEPSPVAAVSVTTRTLSQNFGKFTADRAQYVTVAGQRDPAVQQKVNQALYEPVGTAITTTKNVWSGLCKDQPVPPESPLRVTVRIVAQRPRLLSVVYQIAAPICAGGGSTDHTQAVMVDLTTGRTLGQADVFRPGVLTAGGIGALSAKVPPPARIDELCGFPTLSSDLDRGTLPHVSVNLAADHVEFTWHTRSEECMSDFRVVKVPYTQLTDLLNPGATALVR
jgi:hypothetical protein